MRHRVARLSEIPERQGLLVQVGDVEIGLFRVGEAVYAYENRCAHQGGPVCEGEVLGKYEQILAPDRTTVGYRFNEDELHLVCPWHGWEYRLTTGECVADPRFRLRRVPVEVQDGEVYVHV